MRARAFGVRSLMRKIVARLDVFVLRFSFPYLSILCLTDNYYISASLIY